MSLTPAEHVEIAKKATELARTTLAKWGYLPMLGEQKLIDGPEGYGVYQHTTNGWEMMWYSRNFNKVCRILGLDPRLVDKITAIDQVKMTYTFQFGAMSETRTLTQQQLDELLGVDKPVEVTICHPK